MSTLGVDIEKWEKKGKNRYKPIFKKDEEFGRKLYGGMELKLESQEDNGEKTYFPSMVDPKGKKGGFMIHQTKDKQEAKEKMKKWMKKNLTGD